MRVAGWLVPLAVACWLAACGEGDPPPPAGGAGTSNAPRPLPQGGSSAGPEAGAAADDGDATGAGRGGAGSERPPIGELGGASFAEASGGAPPNPPAQCDPEASWGDARALGGIDTGADERLLAMTYDELTLVFTRDDALLIAERASVDAEFAAAKALRLPDGYTASRGLALAADGSALVLVSEDGLTFAEVTRPTRDAAFGLVPRQERFAYVNDARTFSGGELSSPVLSEDGATFFYVERSPGRSDVWRADGEGVLSERTKLDPVALGGDEGDAKLTLSVSADERTLFVLDEALGLAVGLWSATPAAELSRAVPLVGLESAFTNTDCTRLYGTRSGDVVVQTPN